MHAICNASLEHFVLRKTEHCVSEVLFFKLMMKQQIFPEQTSGRIVATAKAKLG